MCFFCLLFGFSVFELATARVDLTVDSSACKNYYYMKDIGEAYVTYSGASLSDGCNVKFINWDSFQKKICIKPTNLNLDCSTKIEYHRNFIKEHIDPDVRFTCNNVSYNEWCGVVRTAYVYIVFKTSGRGTVTDVRLHVYLKNIPKEVNSWEESTAKSSVAVTLGSIASVIVTIVFICIIVYFIVRKRRSAPRVRFPYRTTPGQITVHPGAAPVQPHYQALPQQSTQGNYQLHPMQSAYPDSTQRDNSPFMTDQLSTSPAPSAPPGDFTAPPPSYESVVSEK